MSELPSGWVEAPLPLICTKITDGTHHSPVNLPTGDYKYVTAKNIRPWGLDLSDISFVDAKTHQEIYARCPVEKGDVLYIKDGATTGLAAVNPLNEPFSMLSSVALLKPNRQAIEPSYLKHWLNSPETLSMMLDKMTGTAIRRLTLTTISAQIFPLAPLREQRRIVAKVDGLTARTARARKELDRIPTLIARYKQRLLVLAFSGQLPALNPNAARAEFYDVGDIVDISSGYGFPKDRQGKIKGDFPFAKVSDISRAVAQNGGELVTASNYVDQEDLKTLKAKPIPAGSIVFAKIGEALKLNRRAIAKVPLILDNNCMALAPDKSKVLPRYLLRFMETVDLGPLSVATAVPSIRRGDVASLQILLPSLDEQGEIVRRIESAFGWLDRMAADHAAAARLLPKLNAAILAKAFRGELVPQDPNDEPAAKLLERIKVAREAAPKQKRGRKIRSTVSPKDLKTMPKNLEQVLAEAGDWISAQDAFQQCGIGGAATTEEIEKIYAELRKLDKAGKLEADPVNDDQGRKLHDRLRLKAA